MEEKFAITILNPKTKKLETFDQRTGELIVKEGDGALTLHYTTELGDAIANLVREGYTLKKIAEIEGMPPLHYIYSWRSGHPDFAKKMKDARKDRATWFHDEAVEVLKESATIEKDEVAREKFRFDSFLKLAERGAPEEYGAKPAGAIGGGAMTIVINTGINREQVIEVTGDEDGKEMRTNTNGEDGRQQTDYDGAIPSGVIGVDGPRDERLGAEVTDASRTPDLAGTAKYSKQESSKQEEGEESIEEGQQEK